MVDDIAYPSEILDSSTQEAFIDRRSAVWIRFLARMFDYSLVYLAVYIARKYFTSFPLYFFYYFPIEYLLFVPIESLFLRFGRASPGKMLLRMKVGQYDQPLSLKTSFRRSLKVYFRGMGLGIVWIYFFSMSVAYSRYLQTGTTAWDQEEKSEIEHKTPNSTNVLAAIFFIIFLFFFKRYA
ncbi:MAG: RDD family protein [Chlamydiota bacterium]